MNVISLASRMIARRRRMILRAAIPIGVATFVFVLVFAVIADTADQVRTAQRVRSGELALRRRAPTGTEVSDPWPENVFPDNTLVSRALIAPAIVSGPRGTELCEVWFTDLESEIGYRGIRASGMRHGAVILAAWDGSEKGIVAETKSLMEDSGTSTAVVQASVGDNDSAATITLMFPGADPLTVPVTTSAPRSEAGNVVLVDQRLMPTDPVPEILVDRVRVRGRSPMERSAVRRISAETGLMPTAWRADSRRNMKELVRLGGILLVLLFVTGGAASAPSVALLVTRYRAEFDLLTATGYSEGYIRRLVSAMGSVAATVTATVGAVAAAIVVAIANVRGGFPPSIVPIDWLERNPGIGSITPSPPVWLALTGIVLAAGVGALAALPAARQATSGGCRAGHGIQS